MSEYVKRRFGDPAARKVGLNRALTVTVVAVAAFCLAIALSALVHWISVGDGLHLLGSAIGIALAALIATGLSIAWRAYWRALGRAVRQESATHPQSLVLGARLPNLASELFRRTWPSGWGQVPRPQQLVLRVDSSGVALLTVGVPIAVVLKLDWDQVAGFSPVEYVEHGFAYEGLAIDGTVEGSAVLLQIIATSPIVRFPRGNGLAEIASRAQAERPPNV